MQVPDVFVDIFLLYFGQIFDVVLGNGADVQPGGVHFEEIFHGYTLLYFWPLPGPIFDPVLTKQAGHRLPQRP